MLGRSEGGGGRRAWDSEEQQGVIMTGAEGRGGKHTEDEVRKEGGWRWGVEEGILEAIVKILASLCGQLLGVVTRMTSG